MFGRSKKRDLLVEKLEAHIARLEKQNEELFAKLMARNLAEYKVAIEHEVASTREEIVYPPDQDDANAGEILEILSDDTEE